ncbi:MAG: hypothetical protein ACJ8ER_08260 [Allosphingosinicella sp.]
MDEADFSATLTGLGAVPDLRELRDVAMAASSSSLTSPSAAFADEDVGKTVVVGGAGASGAKLITTVASIVAPCEILLADSASNAVVAGGAVYGTDCSAALQAGLEAIAAAAGGTLLVDGLFLLAAPVSVDFNGEAGGIAARLLGSGTDSGLWIGTADTDDAITLSSGTVELQDLNFVGVPGASLDARRVLNLTLLSAAIERCGFFGLMGREAIVYASDSYLKTQNCHFGGCFVGLGSASYTHSVIENKSWYGYRDEDSQFIDYGHFWGQTYSKSGTGQNLGWIRADTPNGNDGARGEGVFQMSGTRLDEGALHGVVVKPTSGTVNHVHLDGLRQNVTPATSARGVHCQNVQWVVMERCWQGWANLPTLSAHFQDCGTVLIDSLKLSDSVNSLSATNVTSLTLKDTTGITSFAFTNVNFHPVTSRYQGVSLVKTGPIADSDFVAPPALGTLAFDRTANRLYMKRGTSEGWIYFDMSGGDVFGPELVVNGTFAGGTTTGWTPAQAATLSVVDGALRITNTTLYARAYQGVPTVAGQQYQVGVTIVGGTAGRLVRVGTNQGEGTYATLTGSGGTTTFTATSAVAYISLMVDTEQPGKYADFDNVTLRAI